MVTSLAPVTQPAPLYPVNREYPRPAARQWVEKIAARYSVRDVGPHPWLPLTATEGFLVVGHKDPAVPLPAIPDQIIIRVSLRQSDYDHIQKRAVPLWDALNNRQPPLIEAWGDFECSGRYQQGEFFLKHGLLPRSSSARTIDEYLSQHPDARWIYDAQHRRLPILPVDDLSMEKIPVGVFPNTLIDRWKAVCYDRDGSTLHVVVPSGTSIPSFRTHVVAQLSRDINLLVAVGDPAAIPRLIETASAPQDANASPLDDYAEDSSETVFDCGGDHELLQANPLNLSSARDVLRWALLLALARNATDVHFDVLEKGVATMRLRFQKRMKRFGNIRPEVYEKVIALIKVRCRLNHTERRMPLDGQFKARAGEREADIRVSTIPVIVAGEAYEAAALRILGRVEIPSIEALGISEHHVRQLKWVSGRSHGVFLFTGPTGSGKTTTQSCCLRACASEETNTVSAEDPVELPIKYVRQSQMNKEIGYTYPVALKAFLRQDPDTIAVGEVRDEESADIAMQASQTGHLVFATMHTNTALLSFGRLRDLGIDSTVVANTIIGALSQRLIRVVCPHCSELIAAPEEQVEYVKRFCVRVKQNAETAPQDTEVHVLAAAAEAWLANPTTPRPIGCTKCSGGGFVRMKPIMEIVILQNDTEAVDMILGNCPMSKVQQHYARKGVLDIPSQALLTFVRRETVYEEIDEHMPLL